MVLTASGKHHAPPGSFIPELRKTAFKLGSRQGSCLPTLGDDIPQKEKARSIIPAYFFK
jgi:hypothetical protein